MQTAIGRFVVFVLSWIVLVQCLAATEPAVLRGWIQQLRKPIPHLRVQAAAALAENGPLESRLANEALEALSDCLKDPNRDVRVYAAYALARVGAQTDLSVTSLTSLLDDSDEHVRYSAEWSIAEIAKTVTSDRFSEDQRAQSRGAFETAENRMADKSIQPRHLNSVRLALTRLDPKLNRPSVEASAKSVEETSDTIVSPPRAEPSVAEPATSTPNLQAAAALFSANELTARLTLVHRISNESAFSDELRTAVLEHELRYGDSRVATYAANVWTSRAQRILLQLLTDLSEDDLQTQYAERILECFSPESFSDTDRLVKIIPSPGYSISLRQAAAIALSKCITLRYAENGAIAAATSSSDWERLANIAAMAARIAVDDTESSTLRSEAIALLGLCGKSREAHGRALIETMASLQDDEDVFCELAAFAGKLGEAGVAAMDRLLRGLRSDVVEVRSICAEALANIGPAASIAAPALVARIMDPSEPVGVKSVAAKALKSILGNAAFDLLIVHIQNPEGQIREHVVRALNIAASGDPRLVEPCLTILTDSYEKENVRAAAAMALGSFGDGAAGDGVRHAIPALMEMVGPSKPASLRAAAIIAIAKITPGQASIEFKTLLEDPHRIVRISAAVALHQSGRTRDGVEALMALLDDSESDSIVKATILELGPAASEVLIDGACDETRSALVRLCCFEAAIALPNVDWPRLIELLDDSELGDDFALAMEDSDALESEVIPVLVGELQRGHFSLASRSRVVSIIEAEGFGAVEPESQWADTLAVNQPDNGMIHESRNEPSQISSVATAPRSSKKRSPRTNAAASPPQAVTEQLAAESMAAESLQDQHAVDMRFDASAPKWQFKKGEDRKVSVFYGTNRVQSVSRSPWMAVTWLHATLATLALLAMVGCFFLFPRTSQIRYAIASLVGMGAVSTIALQMMVLSNWRGSNVDQVQYNGDYSSQIQYGVCAVSIPPLHQPGELESPRLLKMEITQDPEKHIVLTHVEPMGQADFHSNLKAEMDRNGKSVFVFVHGYNVSFEDAARRTGQMAFDLKFPGAPIFYSWPSQANWYSYAKDQENIDLSVPQIRSFLLDIAAESGADSIHLIAHSMGNVGLTAALQAMETESTPAFSQVVLAAPDIDAEVFQNEIASKVISKAKRTTLYTSKSDLALVASRYFNQRPRAGDSGPAVLIMDGMDTIDATAVDSSLLGHSYYGSNVTVLDDLGLLFQNKTIADRNYLRSALQNNRPYWEFQPLRLSREPSSPVIR